MTRPADDGAELGVRRPSVVLGAAGAVALLVSLTVLTGVGSLVGSAIGGADGRWALVVLAAVVGVALVALPGRRRRT